MTPDEMAARIDALEHKLEADEAKMQPLIDVFNAGKMLGKILFVTGGVIAGIAAIWTALVGWVAGHVK